MLDASLSILLFSFRRMSKITLFIVLVVVATCGVVRIHAASAADMEKAWQDYQEKFPMGTQTKAELGQRKSNFERIHKIIEEHNADPKSTYKMGHNQFSVLGIEERKQYLMNNTGASTKSLRGKLGFETLRFHAKEDYDLTLRNLPKSVDYRKHHCMQPIKDQVWCSSCSTFAATAAVEFGRCLKTGKPINLSEQQMVDCDPIDRPCGGGSYNLYWKTLITSGGQAYSSVYPYVSGGTNMRNPTCENKKKGAKLAATNPIVALQEGDELGGMKLLANKKVVALCILASDKMMNYNSGVYNEPCDGSEGLHAMAAVGYGTTDDGIKYWIIRNSWGPTFGDAGYILFQRGINLCQVERDIQAVNVA